MASPSQKELRKMSWKALALLVGVLVFGFLCGAFFMTIQYMEDMEQQETKINRLEATLSFIKSYPFCHCQDMNGNTIGMFYMGE